MSGSKSKSSSQSRSSSWSREKSASSTGVWGGQGGYLQDVYQQAQGRFGEGPYSYGASRIADMDPRMSQALGAASGQYAQGQQTLGQAGQALGETLSGDYLDPSRNQSLERMRQIAARGVTEDYYGATQALGSSMEAAGRTGSGAHAYGSQIAQRNLATGLADMSAGIYGQNYQAERDRMMGAVGQAGAQTQAGWQGAQNLAQMGSMGFQHAQALAEEGGARHMFGQTAQDESLARYQQMLGGPVMTSQAMSEAASRSKAMSRSKGKQVSGGIV